MYSDEAFSTWNPEGYEIVILQPHRHDRDQPIQRNLERLMAQCLKPERISPNL